MFTNPRRSIYIVVFLEKIPIGSETVGIHGTKDEVLKYISNIWDDIIPKSHKI